MGPCCVRTQLWEAVKGLSHWTGCQWRGAHTVLDSVEAVLFSLLPVPTQVLLASLAAELLAVYSVRDRAAVWLLTHPIIVPRLLEWLGEGPGGLCAYLLHRSSERSFQETKISCQQSESRSWILVVLARWDSWLRKACEKIGRRLAWHPLNGLVSSSVLHSLLQIGFYS